MSTPPLSPPGRVVWAARNSLRGLAAAWRHEQAFRMECWLALALLPAALWLAANPLQLALLLGSCMLVLAAELGNSGLETAIDRIGTEHHELAGRAKDMGSAMVMLTQLNVPLIWGLVAWHRFGGF